MDTYVDGFLIPVATDRIDDYKAIASLAGQVWKDHGALAYCECIGDDLGAPGMVSFHQAAATAPGETVVFAWIVYPSREDRDRINAAVMADPRMASMMTPDTVMPFDCKRMACGGFRVLVEC